MPLQSDNFVKILSDEDPFEKMWRMVKELDSIPTFNANNLTLTGVLSAPKILSELIYFGTETVNVISGNGVTLAIDWNTNQKQKLTITGAGATLNFDNPPAPCNLTLKIIQGNGVDTITTWDSAIKWAGGVIPTLSNGAGETDIFTFYFDGATYYGVASLDFS